MAEKEIEILQFSNQSANDRKLLRRFVDFHWQHYRDDPQYVPLLNYEYLGSRLLGITGFFEPRNRFFTYADMTWFLALIEGKIVGRCNAFVNRRHNEYWKDKVGFFGQFECVDDAEVARAMLSVAEGWLRERGMEAMRGPQNQPVNEITPGIMTQGFDRKPMVYYPWCKPYYQRLFQEIGLAPAKRVLSWEVPVFTPIEDKLARVAEIAVKRGQVTLESWGDRPLALRKKEMLEIYNEAWGDNFGFVPFTAEEFEKIVDDMMLIMDKKFFVFARVKGEPAAFLGVLPNIMEKMRPLPGPLRRAELLRAAKMLLGLGSIRSIRLGYLGTRRKFRTMGLDGIILWQAKKYAQTRKRLQYCDIGWVLEDNTPVIKMSEMMAGCELARVYTIFQKPL